MESAVVTHKNARIMCGPMYTAGHWNPYHTKSAQSGNGMFKEAWLKGFVKTCITCNHLARFLTYVHIVLGTVDQYEIGDLSGKYGTLGNHNRLSLNGYKDYNLPLFGLHSVLYRSLVIHFQNASRWVCTNIQPKNPTFQFKAKANFVGPDFKGVILVVSWSELICKGLY